MKKNLELVKGILVEVLGEDNGSIENFQFLESNVYDNSEITEYSMYPEIYEGHDEVISHNGNLGSLFVTLITSIEPEYKPLEMIVQTEDFEILHDCKLV